MATSAGALNYVRDLVRRRSGIVLDADKDYLIESRLTAVAREVGCASVEDVITRARTLSGGDMNVRVVEALTTNETSFFRDVHPFEALRDEILPAVLAARAVSRTVRIWSAACSTGQEPYSIAMTLREHFASLTGWRVRITATDLAESILARARQGQYRQLEVNRGLPAPLLIKYFERNGADWSVRPDVRAMVEFRALNLIEPVSPFPQADVVFLRNVLIYFDVPTRRAVLKRVREALAPDGYLFLGGAETTTNIDDAFERVQAGKAAYHRIKR